ncbi:MAG: septal ring lytic transglycosylase RlpA family protein [Hyphomicrobiaceae bacterium]
MLRLLLSSAILIAPVAVQANERAKAESTRHELARHEFASSWRTTVKPAAVAPISTGSLPTKSVDHALHGIASYYWQDQMTSSGERFDKTAMTAAHKTLPMGTRVRVTHKSNGRSVIVRINDRGPFKAGRVIDLSEAAAKHIQMTANGLAAVTLEVIR